MRRLLTEARESFAIAVGAIRANPLRGVLTTLGIIIGIVGVVSTMTAANGVRNAFRESVSSLGTDVVYVSRMPWVIRGNFFNFRNRPPVSMAEFEDLAHVLGPRIPVNPTVNSNRSVKYMADVIDNVDIIGTTERQLEVSASVPELGRFLTGFDVQFKRRVCVIGFSLREGLFGDADPINKTIKIGRHDFRVVGVMEKQGSAGFFGGPDFDSQIIVPITAFTRAFGGRHRDFNIAVQAPTGTSLADFEYRVVGEMRKIRRLPPTAEDDFSINKMDSLVASFDNVMGIVLGIGMLITGISLLVGGIGVMNIMFVSVTERTREIGIRKAIGAKRRAILAQFLFESSIICLIGGAIGVALAFGVTEAIDRLLLPASISLPIVAVAFVVSILVGVLSGYFPARRAARLSPIDALRYE